MKCDKCKKLMEEFKIEKIKYLLEDIEEEEVFYKCHCGRYGYLRSKFSDKKINAYYKEGKKCI